MAGSWTKRICFLHQQERSPSVLTDYLTFCFLICSLEAWRNLGTWLAGSSDTGKASNNQLFWEGIQESFTSNLELFDNLHFEEKVLSTLHHLNLKKIVHHDWNKLCAMWKNLNVEYKAVLTKYTMSGTHLSNFFEFCHGRHDVYYLRKHL